MLIGTRTLKLSDGIDTRDVEVRLFSPEESSGDWACRYEIDWPKKARKNAAHGVDAIQALHLALQRIGAELYTSEEHAAGRLSWETPGMGYGFPVPKNARDLLVGDDKVFEG